MDTPLRMAYAFVVIFFMLSGFVLALPYNGPSPSSGYLLFLIKRFCRLYIPFALIMSLAFLFYVLTGTGPLTINDMTYHTQNLPFSNTPTWVWLGKALLMTGVRDDNLINPPVWTLIYEMRIALIFPLLVLLCRRAWLAIPFMIACYVFVWIAEHSVGRYDFFPAITPDFPSTWITTIYVIPCFMFGIFLAQYKNRILSFLSSLSIFWRMVLWVLVTINFCFLPDFDIRQPFTEFGAIVFLGLVLSSDVILGIARTGLVRWLSRISYSVYLVHLPILFMLRNLWEGQIALIWLFALCFVMTFPIATLTQRFIEVPASHLAKKLFRPTP